MKGVVFTEFMDHVETAHGPLVVDKIIETSDTQSQGAYTAVGTYPCAELVSLIVSLSQHSGIDVPEIITQFGESLAVSFKRDFPAYYEDVDYFDFVERVESHIHIDVLKLYPDAELPRFKTVSRDEDVLVIDYISSRSLEHLALGLLTGSARHFNKTANVSMRVFEDNGQRIVRFTISCD